MSIYIKYSKNSEDISNLKKDFFSQNDQLIKKNNKLISFLKKQPLRKKCKNCGFKLKKINDFYSHNLGYKICLNCSHLNSQFEDSANFHKKVYQNDASSYSDFYRKDYEERVKKIYIPKADFLIDYLKYKRIKNIKILDFGCGSGHFVKALQRRKIDAVGVESNLKMIDFGQLNLNKNSLIHSASYEKSLQIIKNSDCNILSLISVLEHLENPNKIFENFKVSKFKYLFISIPLFNLSVFIENVFQNVYPRHSGITHPHLYTYKSIKYILKKYNLKITGEWWFGTEMVDLNKSFLISFKKNKSKIFLEKFNSVFTKHINELQKTLDKKKMSSEVHLIVEK